MDLRSWRVWLRPGMLIKRWVMLFLLSVVVIGLAMAMGLAWIYRNVDFPGPTAGHRPHGHPPVHPPPVARSRSFSSPASPSSPSRFVQPDQLADRSVHRGDARQPERRPDRRRAPLRADPARAQHRHDRRRHRALDPAPRSQARRRRHHRDRHRRRRRRQHRPDPQGLRHSGSGRHPQLPRRPGRRRIDRRQALPVPLRQGRLGAHRPLVRQPLHHRAHPGHRQLRAGGDRVGQRPWRSAAGCSPRRSRTSRSAPSWSTARSSAANRRSRATRPPIKRVYLEPDNPTATNRRSARSSTPT